MVERQEAGVYNATGPTQPLSFGQLLLQCQCQSQRPSKLNWVGDETLMNAGVEPGNDLPLWNLEADAAGWGSISSERARKRGLAYRPMDVTIADTLHWDEDVIFRP